MRDEFVATEPTQDDWEMPEDLVECEGPDCPLPSSKAVVDRLLRDMKFQVHASIKAVDAEKRIIKGFASTNDVDRVNDVVEPGAFKRTARPFLRDGVLLHNHNADEGVGVPTAADIRPDKGLFIAGRIGNGFDSKDRLVNPIKELVWNDIQDGILRKFSIGFRILKAEAITKADPNDPNAADRRITEVDLFEVSLVRVPANARATFNVAKAVLYGSDCYDVATKTYMAPTWDTKQGPACKSSPGDKTPSDYSRATEYVKMLAKSMDGDYEAERAMALVNEINSAISDKDMDSAADLIDKAVQEVTT